MRKEDQSYSFISKIDVSATIPSSPDNNPSFENASVHELLTAMVRAQNRQNDLLEEVVEQLGAAQRQRSLELANWKRMNPELANACRMAAQKLNKVQTEFLTAMSEQIDDNFETLIESEYFLTEFLDRFGPRFMHLNIILQMLSQLGNPGEMQKETL